MADKRPRSQIGRLLQHLREPVYFVDSEWRIRFCNRACLEWLACREEDILDRRCAFHSSLDVEPGDALAAGLCPPPGAMDREETVGTVACLTPQGQLRRRRARFLQVHNTEGQPGLLVVVSAADLEEEPVGPGENTAGLVAGPLRAEAEALTLHERIREFRRSAAARYHIQVHVGTSSAAKRLQQQIEAAGTLDVNVLILEPPGGGGVEVARAIFYASHPSPQQCLVSLPCEGLDPEILRNTLQAFDAIALPAGLWHMFILENVDQLPLPSQQVLLHYLRGGKRSLRVTGTTRVELSHLVRQGRFVEELSQELSTFLIAIPPLVDRREDIPLIAQTILEDCNAQGQKQVMGFEPAALEVLVQHAWPQNYEELARVVKAAHETTAQALISVEDLPRDFRWAFQQKLRALREPEKISLPAYLASVEKELLTRALRRARGNKSLAAKMLGVSRPKLYRRLVQYGIITPDKP